MSNGGFNERDLLDPIAIDDLAESIGGGSGRGATPGGRGVGGFLRWRAVEDFWERKRLAETLRDLSVEEEDEAGVQACVAEIFGQRP